MRKNERLPDTQATRQGQFKARNVGDHRLAPAGTKDLSRQHHQTAGVGRRGRRRVVLVALPWMRDGHHQPMPLGHASILARLQTEPTLDVRSIIRPVNDSSFNAETVAKEVTSLTHELRPQDVDVAIGAYVWNDNAVRNIIRLLRGEGFKGRIILGGPQITYAGPGLETLYPGVDAFVRGFGEQTLAAVAGMENQSAIKGVHFAGEPDRLELSEPMLTDLPSPWLNGVINPAGMSSVHWETQRGCQFRCSFCQHRQRIASAPIPTGSPERLSQEISLLCRTSPKRISILDPVFNSNETRASKILQQFIAHGFTGEVSLQCRAELIDLRNPAFLDAAERLNVTLEFGLQSIVAREFLAIGRPNNLPKVEAVLAEVRRRKIRHEVSLIYGLPEQTLESFRANVEWCLRRRIPTIRAFPLLLLRGTPLAEEGDRWGLRVQDALLPFVTASNTFDDAAWQEMDAIANALTVTEGAHPDSVAKLPLHSEGVSAEFTSPLRSLGRL